LALKDYTKEGTISRNRIICGVWKGKEKKDKEELQEETETYK
jgi:hypothetical protein